MLVALLAVPFVVLADTTPPEWGAYWQEIPASQLPALTPEGDLAAYRTALDRQLENCREFEGGHFSHCAHEPDPGALACDVPVLQRLRDLAGAAKDWSAFYAGARAGFRWFRFRGAGSPVQFTGYNAPLFQGTLAPDDRHRFPLYRRPADLVDVAPPGSAPVWKKRLADGTFAPYDDRKAIDVGQSLRGENLEVAWMEFPSEALRLHIEGSGVLEVRDGKETRQYGLSFAGKNGLPYVSVFKTLRDKGVDKKYLSFPGLKQYFLDFPDDMWPTLVTNPSYTFFSLTDEPPCGATRAYLTGGHSIATDPTRLPLGAAALLSAARPDPAHPGGSLPFTRFALAQDTGSAIQGAHVDVYWGTGDYAQLASDSMNSQGSLFLPKLK
jgi:membrane-bound lytic murein transglycosylase A